MGGEYPTELKVAGAHAYNRWLAEFCSEAPERLLGVAMIGQLRDVDAAIEEVRWANENGINGGALLPVSPPAPMRLACAAAAILPRRGPAAGVVAGRGSVAWLVRVVSAGGGEVVAAGSAAGWCWSG